MNQCRRCHKEIPEGETLCEECKANDENYLDDLLRSVDTSKTDHRSDLPQKKGTPIEERNRKMNGADTVTSEEYVSDDEWEQEEFDELDLEFSKRLGRDRDRSKKGRRRRKRRENIKAEDFDLEGKTSPEKDFTAVKIADSLLDVLEDEDDSYEEKAPLLMSEEGESAAGDDMIEMIGGADEAGDDIMAMLENEDAGGEAPEDDIPAMLENEDAGGEAPEDDILAMLENEDAGGEAPEDDIPAMLENEDSGEEAGEDDLMKMFDDSDPVKEAAGDVLMSILEEADEGVEAAEDDIMAMLENEDTGGEAPEDDIMAMLENDNTDGQDAGDDLMAMLEDDNAGDSAPKEEDDVMALLSEDEGETGPVSDDDLMALMDDSGEGSDDLDSLMGMMESDSDNIGDLELDGDDKDIFSIDDLLDEDSAAASKKEGKISDVGDIISDSLSAVSSKEEEESLEAQLLGSVEEKKEKKKSKAGAFFAKLFGNVVDDKSQKQFEDEQAYDEKVKFKKAEKARIKAGDLTEAELKQKEDKEAAIAQAKEEKKQKQEAKKAQAEEKKAQKLEKKKKLAEQRAEEEALNVDEGRINRAGASVVFLFFACIAAVVLIGSSRFSYATSIKKAGNYFNNQKYNRAYNEVSGLKIRDKDEEIYSKIMTVMYVNKELNSYNNYYSIQFYGEALDSLLKGLKRYDKYISDARELGIESDLNYVRRQILAELKRTFGISEAEAVSLNKIEDRAEYSSQVISIAETVVVE